MSVRKSGSKAVSCEPVLKLRGVLFVPKRPDGGRDDGAYPSAVCDRGATKPEAFSAKTLRAAGLLSGACVGSAVTAHCRDAPASPPWPQPKSLAAESHAFLKQTLKIVGAARGDEAGPVLEFGLPVPDTLRQGEGPHLLADYFRVEERLGFKSHLD